jgi:hypothetical protein
MTNEEIIAYQTKERAFAQTPLGKAFHKFENATARAWQLDIEDSFTDRNRKATRDAWAAHSAARQEFREMLEKLV